MTKPTTISASKLSIWLGDGASPEVFAAPCGLNGRVVNLAASPTEVAVPDCDDPDLPAWIERDVESLSLGVSGSGLLAMEALDAWREFAMNGQAKNCRIVIDHAQAGRFEGSFVCTGFNITGQGKGRVQVEVSIASNGEVAWVAT